MSIQDQVIADLEARKQVGLKSYGTLLQPHNGRDMLQDLYEELLDACCYVKGAMIERDEEPRAGEPTMDLTEERLRPDLPQPDWLSIDTITRDDGKSPFDFFRKRFQ